MKYAKLKTWAIMALSFILIKCDGQPNPSIPSIYLKNYQISNSERQSIITQTGAVDITNYLPANYSKNGNVDYTYYIQKGILENKNVLFPNFPILIDDKGLKVPNNSVLIFNKNSKIILKGSFNSNYNILDIRNIKNVKVYFAQIVGDRDGHNGKGGEWGMGIGIWNSANVNIIKPFISNCWGDGIYVNGGTNINILNPVLNHNRRNGISIISGDSIVIKNMLSANTDGTLPKAGIDIEPNNNKVDYIKHVTIDNPITYNNYRGILVSLYNMSGSLDKKVNVQINNPIDDGSNRGIDLYVNKKKFDDRSISGSITINNPKWVNQKETPMFYNTYGYDNVINVSVNYSNTFKDIELRKKIIKNISSSKKVKVNLVN